MALQAEKLMLATNFKIQQHSIKISSYCWYQVEEQALLFPVMQRKTTLQEVQRSGLQSGVSRKSRVEAEVCRFILHKLILLLYGFDCNNICGQVTVSKTALITGNANLQASCFC